MSTSPYLSTESSEELSHEDYNQKFELVHKYLDELSDEKSFDLAKVKIKEILKTNKNKLALALNIWTAHTQQLFLVITVNW
ncbi:12945_t:CDS:2, partial [Gigaspora rosea]